LTHDKDPLQEIELTEFHNPDPPRIRSVHQDPDVIISINKSAVDDPAEMPKDQTRMETSGDLIRSERRSVGGGSVLPTDSASDPLDSDFVRHAATLVELKSVLKKRKKERSLFIYPSSCLSCLSFFFSVCL
jgi:hypothetical protein